MWYYEQVLVIEDLLYTGKLLFYEEKGKESWIALSEYIIEDKYDIKKYSDTEFPSILMIRMSDIEYIELYYNKDNSILN